MNYKSLQNPLTNKGVYTTPSGDTTLDDDIDIANEYAQKVVDVAIANAHARAETPINDTGECIWCSNLVKDTRRWCSIECRDEYERHNK
jgi:hypothetical protein